MSTLTLRARRMANIARTLGVITYADGDEPRDLTSAETEQYLADADTWWAATTLPELAALTADWLEGHVLYLPAYGAASPDPETRGLIPTLAAANRAGFMTGCSQPGHEPTVGYDGWTWQQAAAVTGFCDQDTALSLYRTFMAAGLTVMIWQPGSRVRGRDHDIEATIRENPESGEGWVNTVFGPPRSRRELRQTYRGDLNPTAVKTLQNSWQVIIAETEYGRNDRVWPLLVEWAENRPAT